MQELLRQPYTTDVDRDQALGLAGAGDELRGPAADVDDEVGLGVGSAGGRAELEPRFFLAAQELGSDAEQLLDRIEEIVAVRCVARRGW